MWPASSNEHEDAADLEEGVPLLPKCSELTSSDLHEDESVAQLSARSRIRKAAWRAYNDASEATMPSPMFGTSHHNKVLCYDHNTLLTSRSLMSVGCSVFGQKPVLHTLVYCSLVAAISALGVFFIPKASKFDTQKFQDFGHFLKFFIVFMLGIYVQQAFKRWWLTATTFEKILIGIRQLVFMLHTLHCTPASRKMIESYCIASGYILNVEVRNAQMVDQRHHVDIQGVYQWLEDQGLMSEEDVLQLGNSSNLPLSHTRAIWSWIGELVSNPVTEEGSPVLPPLLVRTISLCQGCISEIENLKMNITMQTPFMYAQLLAILVHMNNIILSLSCGMALGSSLNEIRRRSEQLVGERDTSRQEVTLMAQLYEAIQTIGVQTVIVLLCPMLYIAFLHIAHILSYPFGDESHHLPTETMIARMHSELNHMSTNRAYFRQKHKEFSEKERRLQRQGKDKKGLKDDADDDDDDGGDGGE